MNQGTEEAIEGEYDKLRNIMMKEIMNNEIRGIGCGNEGIK